jgi:hypothetical protein
MRQSVPLQVAMVAQSCVGVDYRASGMFQEEILRDFPDLVPEDIRACLAFAAERERRLIALPPT